MEEHHASGEARQTPTSEPPDREAGFVEPMQCKAVTALPAEEDWTFEIKFDGYRCIAVKSGPKGHAVFAQREDVQPPLSRRR
jgi:ATP-dependent DNA ligase